MNGLLSAFALDARYPRVECENLASVDAKPRLFVDISVIFRHDAQTGIQRVVRAVWTNLIANPSSPFQVVPVFATRFKGYRTTRPDFLDLPKSERQAAGPVVVAPGDSFLGLDLSAHLLPKWQRQVCRWRKCGASINVVAYDLLPVQRPQWFNPQTRVNFQRWVSFLPLHCDRVLCISDDVARQVAALFDGTTKSPAVRRLHMAGDIEGSYPSRGIDEDVRAVQDRTAASPTVLMVGTIEPRKGYDTAIDAFDLLWQEDADRAPNLVIVGKPGWHTVEIQDRIQNHQQFGRRLFWLKSASDEALALMYGHCTAALLTSHAEGFGLPAIEAAMRGRHVLVRDLPVFREQGLTNLSYFEDDSPAALADSIRQLLDKAKDPPPPARLPTWEACVGLLVETLSPRPDQPDLDMPAQSRTVA